MKLEFNKNFYKKFDFYLGIVLFASIGSLIYDHSIFSVIIYTISTLAGLYFIFKNLFFAQH
ncbi:hypothetical protein [Paucilactobacillus nenjiangensis]|uniref:hypothetical protein n=1 Tax=Paucilactobacillus nenjiangensis TaxID=1296540 RepID=UPI0028D60835|nr:hypothetical protein [Paucilactobacillus nenjiangensis]